MPHRLQLPLGNAIACCLFVVLRAPVAPAYLAEIDALEATNLVPPIATGLVHVVWLVSPTSAAGAQLASACARSWGLAAVFVLLATTQWLALGWVLDRATHRRRRTAA